VESGLDVAAILVFEWTVDLPGWSSKRIIASDRAINISCSLKYYTSEVTTDNPAVLKVHAIILK
jgi:hypothetical protein